MNKCIGALLCIVLLFGSFTTPVRAGSDQNQVLIAQLQAMIILLQQQLQVLQAKEMNAIDKELSVTQKRFEFGPKRNAMSCDRVGTKLSDGTVACYGLHDYGNEFGEDQNTCGGLDPSHYKKVPTGCVISAPICSSGKAIATDYFSPSSKTESELRTLATRFATTPLAVTSQLLKLWEYRCTNKSLTSLDSVSIYEADPASSLDIHRSADYSKKDWSFVKRPSQVVVVGVYQGEIEGGGDRGTVDVSLDFIEPDTLLVLSSYEPVVWNLVGAQVRNVKGIYLTGYSEQRVAGAPSNVKVSEDIYQDGSDGYFIVYNGTGDEDDDFYELRSYIHAVTKQKTYLYFGGYEAGKINVNLKG